MQALLLPYTFEVNPLEAGAILENMEQLLAMGFDVQEIGKNSFAIHAIPATLDEKEVESFILEIASAEISQLIARGNWPK